LSLRIAAPQRSASRGTLFALAIADIPYRLPEPAARTDRTPLASNNPKKHPMWIDPE
jgi:hypothetical protein